jgi:hypothetical protein|tara:strand:- start:71 stop:529 length:459 start_codon:yes stop_codon:yes gene_type:complete
MQYNLYKPNSYNSGCAFSFKIISKDKEGNETKPSFLIQGIKQASWDNNKKTGSFSANAKDPEKNIYIKLNEHEVGSLIYSIEKYIEFKAFHSYKDDKTQISFKPYEKKNGGNAFSFSIVKNGSLKFGLGIELGEARALVVLLQMFLTQFFKY